MEDAQQKGESGLTNRSLSGRTFGTSRTTNRSFGGTKRNIHEDTLLVRDTPLVCYYILFIINSLIIFFLLFFNDYYIIIITNIF